MLWISADWARSERSAPNASYPEEVTPHPQQPYAIPVHWGQLVGLRELGLNEHWLQDSSHKNFANMCPTRTMHAVSSYTIKPPDPRPEPIARSELKSIGVSRRDGRTTGTMAYPGAKMSWLAPSGFDGSAW